MSVIPVQNQLPALLDHRGLAVFEAVSQDERAFLKRAGDLFRDEYYDHSSLISGMQRCAISVVELRPTA
jgi:hypothetical protein